MIPLQDQLTAQFYRWEEKGRGWKAFEEPVDLEPHFYPFFFHYVPPPVAIIDDGKRHTIFSSIGEIFKAKSKQEPEPEYNEDEAGIAHPFACDEPIRTYAIYHIPA
jgi:hypothetical protein